MKKIIFVLLTALCILALVACGSSIVKQNYASANEGELEIVERSNRINYLSPYDLLSNEETEATPTATASEPSAYKLGDVNKDGKITNLDLLLIFKYIFDPEQYPLEDAPESSPDDETTAPPLDEPTEEDTAMDSYGVIYTNGLIFELNSDSSAYIVKEYTGSSAEVIVPESFEGLPVVSIGDGAFKFDIHVTNISLPNSLRTIEREAFADCFGLTEVILPDGLTDVGVLSFDDCINLEQISIPESVSNIISSAFSDCNKLIEKENGVWYVDKWVIDCDLDVIDVVLREDTYGITIQAFYGCSSLRSIILPDTLKHIKFSAFLNCSNLESITIPNGVTIIENQTFNGCSSLTSITIPDSVTNIGDRAFYNCTSLTSITIPDSVTSIGEFAFNYCTGLTSITIPDSVTSIDDWAFNGCSSLTSITIPDSVINCGNQILSGCSGLEEIIIGNNIKSFENISHPVKLFVEFPYLRNIVIGTGITEIPSQSFRSCTSLTSITIPDSVTSIGNSAFDGCTGLTSITFNENSQLASIGDWAFYNCTSLTSITIPDSVTSIGSSAFYNCTSLTSITIPDSVTSIGDSAFRNCTSLETVYFTGTEEQWAEISIGYNNTYLTDANIIFNYGKEPEYSEGLVFALNADGTAYSVTDYTGTATEVMIPDSYDGLPVTVIGTNAFGDCTSLTSVSIPDSVTRIEGSAFSWCEGLTSVIFGENSQLVSIGSEAFFYCSSLESITIPDGVTSIGNSAFNACLNLASITIPDSVASIDAGAFYNCESLGTVNYTGTGEQWTAISISEGNDCLSNATINYNYVPEE